MIRDQIEAAYRRLLGVWNRRDAEAFAAAFTEDGHFVGFDGSVMNGRAEIASTLKGVFQNERIGAYVANVLDIRDMAPGVVLLRSIVGMIPPEVTDMNLDIDLTINGIQSVVFVQRDAPKVALMQSTPASFRGRTEVADSLMREVGEMLRHRGVEH